MQQMVADPPAAHQQPRVLGEPCDYQLRFLAPGLGIHEDPVTGSAHALVAPGGKSSSPGPVCTAGNVQTVRGMVCEAHSSGMIRLSGAGYLLWDGTLQPGCPAPCAWDDLLS